VKRLAIILLLTITAPVLADDTMPPAPWAYRQLPNSAQEAQAQALMETLRCLQCQGQSIADSDAPIAGTMRSLVRERIAGGEKPEAIRRWLMLRYGDYVSYAPVLSVRTWPLFVLPLVLVALAVLLLRRRFARSAR
jgi:cytochrome c-type biogenesis protein CcmH/NrfF